MTTERKTNQHYNRCYHNITRLGRLVVGVALFGLIASFTHGFYLGLRPIPVNRMTALATRDLEKHGDDSHNSSGDLPPADPRHIRGIKRAEDY